MRIIVFITLISILTSCLTAKRFNKILDKGIEKGWIDTTKVKIDSIFLNRVDTLLLTKSVNKIIDSIIIKTIIKDSCYDKRGNYVGTSFDKVKLEKKLKSKILDSLVLPQTKCLKKPLFIKKRNILIKITQLDNGDFDVKLEIKPVTINRPKTTNWFQDQLKVWYLWLVIFILLLLFAIKK